MVNVPPLLTIREKDETKKKKIKIRYACVILFLLVFAEKKLKGENLLISYQSDFF